tara:strand:- start:120 stop:1349 length:1230 start_codon:yes stop_codon:yes gene_type:complete
MKIIPCVIGLGYVGLPIAQSVSKKFDTYGFDTNNERIKNLKKRIDFNNEYKKDEFKKFKKINFTNKILDIKKCNFFILCVPTPIYKDKRPDLRYLINATNTISKVLKKNDIIFIESTVYPGITEKCKNILEKKTKLKNNKDFFIGYSPERVNPGDKIHTLQNIPKIVSIKTKNKEILKRIYKIYNQISKKIIRSSNIRASETSKVIENIQRDINIAFMNEVLLICKKLKIDFNEVIRLAKTKWNFLNFRPGLVGGHCLPVDPYYLSNLAAKKKFKTKITLAGRSINDGMVNYVISKINNFLKKKGKNIQNSKIIIVGLTYKPGVADMRNSLNFEIFKKIKNKNNKTSGFDPFVSKAIKLKYKIHKSLKNFRKYDTIVFLSYHKSFEKEYKKIIKQKNNSNILDPFNYYC